MSNTLSNVAVTEFDSMVKHAFQNASLLRDTVTVRNNVIGDTYKFRAMGKGLANQKTTSADVDPMDVAHSTISATLQNWNAPEYTDIFDQAEVNFDEKQELASTIAGALGRRLDQLVIDAMDAASPTAVGTGGTGLVATDLIDAKVELVKQGVGSGDLYCAINAAGLAGLLADEKTTSADYQAVKALVNGEINTFAGFNVVVIEDRSGASGEGGLTIASDVVSAYAYSKEAIGLAVGIDMKTSIDYVPQKTSFLCNGMLKAGAAVRDASGLVEINYDATPA